MANYKSKKLEDTLDPSLLDNLNEQPQQLQPNDFISKLLSGPIYNYSKSPEENEKNGSALTAPNVADRNAAKLEQLKVARPDLYVRATPQELANRPVDVDMSQEPLKIEADVPNQQNEQPTIQTQSAPKFKPKSLSDLLGNLTSQSDNELENAQQDRNDRLRNLALARAGATLGSALVQRQTPENFLQTEMEQANLPVSDILQKRKAIADKQQQAISNIKTDYDLQKAQLEMNKEEQRNDPTSDVSKAFRDYAKQYIELAGAKVNVPDNLSYNDMQERMGVLGNIINTKMAMDAKRQTMLMTKELGMQQYNEKNLDKQEIALGKDLDFQRAGLRTNVGKLQDRLNRSENLRALLDSNPGNLTSQELRELVTGVNNLIGGSNAVTQIEHMDYPTYQRTMSELLTKVYGTPVSANSKEVEERLKSLIDREENKIKDQLLDSTNISSKYRNLKQSRPEIYQAMVDEAVNKLTKKAQEKTNIKAGPAEKIKPQTVIQNGHTYTLNPETGEYE